MNEEIIDIINNKERWTLTISDTVYAIESEDRNEFISFVENNKQCNNLNELLKGHLKKENMVALSYELKELNKKKSFDKLSARNFQILNDLIEAGEYCKKLIEQNNIDYYMDMLDTWFLPSGLNSLAHFCGLDLLTNIDMNGLKLFEFLEKRPNYYEVLMEFKAIPNFCVDAFSNFEENWYYPDWENVVSENKYVGEMRMDSLFRNVQKKMHLKKYKNKYYIHFIYKNYTPSKQVISSVKDYAKKHISEDLLQDLEIIYYPSEYEGYARDRSLFNNPDCIFTGEELHITFD